MEWNTQKKIWQVSTENQLLELWEPFLGTWPTSGMMRNGQVFELPMQERHTSDLGYSSLPTPTASDKNDRQRSDKWHGKDLVSTVKADIAKPQINQNINWGKFEPAIRRWESVLGRPAPSPTKPDGRDGAHRLSSAFTEWMMGVPEGWITDCGLKRNEELKACGNGVVPQQAELALRILLDGFVLETVGEGQVNLPTPTVSDTFTDNLKSTQQKPGSMHSVTLPQAVRMLS